MSKRRKEQPKSREWAVPPHVRVTREFWLPAPSLFAHLSVAQFVLGALVIAAIYRPFEPQDDYWMRVWMWACFGALGFALFCVLTLRIYIQDWLSTLSVPERLLVIIILLAALWLPGPPQYHSIIPEGLATLMPALLFFSASGAMARRYVFVAMIGFWTGISWHGGIGLEWVLGFGATLLWNLSAIHVAYLGSPFGLRGWWPFFRIWRTVIFYFIPAALAAVLFFYNWPEPPPIPARQPGRPQLSAREMMQRLSDLDSLQWKELIIRASVSSVVIMAALIALYYMRKYLSKNLRPKALPTVMGADVGEIEYASTDLRGDKPVMDGNRGRVLRLWKRWERAVQPEDAERESGETAAEFAARMDANHDAAEKSAIARMLEQAHYSEEEPDDAEVRAMETLVEEDLKRRT